MKRVLSVLGVHEMNLLDLILFPAIGFEYFRINYSLLHMVLIFHEREWIAANYY